MEAQYTVEPASPVLGRPIVHEGSRASRPLGVKTCPMFRPQRGKHNISPPPTYKAIEAVETEQTPIRDRLPDHRLRCYKRGTLALEDDRSDNMSMTNRPVEALG